MQIWEEIIWENLILHYSRFDLIYTLQFFINNIKLMIEIS